ncbi:acetyl/propionyl/methylcrotonyl-CoA carboxylase subunit alpha [Streptomyces sp. AA1529]|uniref:acetyl/propionyl/methylcrotonyl-CoA carboxylase subunit alpha n=1 Tax=Streptomyces sp. AA1529 TaxID=1203257 RepID=UPI000303126A|nr:biotin carboxylase N-terminal domain-containing protein [Streptomyces sp. AA1529]
MIQSVLVANRGEIARRVFRTCRELGIATVAVHSDADAGAPHVREADAAVPLPGSAPGDTYLRGDLVVRAALAAGADAVHPGYGFLSENAGFARAVQDAGLVWIGPPPAAIEAMASKTAAKKLLAGSGVPLPPSLEPDRVREADLPVLVKAAAGGGGRGMRVVRDRAALAGELAAARAEAAAAFGDGDVFVEPYLERGRHVEVQVLADGHGTVWALGTRDCSLQRRHQKVVEEAPAPGLDDALRRTLEEAAVAVARTVDYTGAGTVEFLVSDRGEPSFLEMNTRLQVEHPVTEAVFGLDLVAQQIRIAEGAALPAEGPPAAHGHAVEARLYAEDPARDWAPQTGRLWRLAIPGSAAGQVRVDSGVEDGDLIGIHYDPMLAKVVAWAPTREAAVRKLARALEQAAVHGPVTNRDLLVRSLRHPDFADVAAGRLDTGFYARHLAELTAPEPADTPDGAGHAVLAAALAEAVRDAPGRPRLAARVGGWRNLPSAPASRRYLDGDGTEHEVRYVWGRGGVAPEPAAHPGVRAVAVRADHVVLETDGVRRGFDVAVHGDRVFAGRHAFTARPRLAEPAADTAPGSLLAQLPGTVVRVAEGIAEGAEVAAGQPLLWLEAMKMEHRVVAPADGTVTELRVAVGRQVEVGAVLAVVTPPAAATP